MDEYDTGQCAQKKIFGVAIVFFWPFGTFGPVWYNKFDQGANASSNPRKKMFMNHTGRLVLFFM